MPSLPLKLFIIDNYDSFTYNLVHVFARRSVEIKVLRNDAATVAEIRGMKPDALCLSPGPGTPADSGVCRELVRSLMREVPMLGVCLGMQVMNEALGGSTIHAPLPVHGKTSVVTHSGEGILRGLPSPFVAARYHSLCLGNVAPGLQVCAQTDDGVIMGIRHQTLPLFGVQFHPESFMSEHGALFAKNFLRIANANFRKRI